MLSNSVLGCLWIIARRRLANAKKRELELRTELTDRLFSEKRLGVNYSKDGAFKLTYKQTYTLDKDHDRLMAAMEMIQREFPDAAIGDAIKWNPTISQFAYNALPKPAQTILNTILTIKDAAPMLAVATEKDAE